MSPWSDPRRQVAVELIKTVRPDWRIDLSMCEGRGKRVWQWIALWWTECTRRKVRGDRVEWQRCVGVHEQC